MPNSTRLWKLLKIAEFRTPTPKDVREKYSKILKLLPVRSCFTLAMTNKLVVINRLKVPKIKKILIYEMKFLVRNYSCLQNPRLVGYRPPDPRSLCRQLNLLNPPPPEQKSWVRHWASVNAFPDRHSCLVFGLKGSNHSLSTVHSFFIFHMMFHGGWRNFSGRHPAFIPPFPPPSPFQTVS